MLAGATVLPALVLVLPVVLVPVYHYSNCYRYVAALSGALSCGAGGRRLETDAASAPSVPSESTTAQTIVDDFLSRRPDLAGTLTAEQRAGMEELGQHFGVPALA